MHLDLKDYNSSMHKTTPLWHERQSGSSFVESVWSCSAPVAAARTVIADPCISFSLVKNRRDTRIVVRGPAAVPHQIFLPSGYSCTTIRLKPGVFLKGLPVQELISTSRSIPVDMKSRFWIDGACFQFPDFDNVELLIDRLHESGHLDYKMPESSLEEGAASLSSRTYARQVRRITGLSPYRLYQLRRIHQALRLLKQGVPAIEVAAELDFVDQSHLTRAAKQFFGCTPRQLYDLPQAP
jgi:AraC-like DNA-binding protein